MEDKKIIITEDAMNVQPKIDLRTEDKILEKNKANIPNSRIFEMYQKYQNISLERDHVLTLRRSK